MNCTRRPDRFLRLTLFALSLGSAIAPGMAAGTTQSSPASAALSREPAKRAAAVSAISVDAPPLYYATEGIFVTFTATAGSGDPHSIITITSSGAPPGLAFTTNTPAAIQPRATWSGIPEAGTAGSWSICWHATDQLGASAEDTTLLIVVPGNRPPVLTQPISMTVSEGTTATQGISATDPDGDPLTFAKVLGPGFMMVSTTGLTTGDILLAPGLSDAGSYTARVSVSDRMAASESDDFGIVVNDSPSAPTADPGGPYTGVSRTPLNFDGRGSSDPDGGELAFLWDFGDGTKGVGATPTHTYSGNSTYRVCLVVTDSEGLHSDPACTTARISGIFFADIFVLGGSKAIHLTAGRPDWCLQIQPSTISGGFTIEDVIFSSIRLRYGAGAIAPNASKIALGGDRNGDGVQEISACFARADLVALFSGLPQGRTTVTIGIDGDLTSGAKFFGSLEIDVLRTGTPLGASVAPNPLNPDATLTFTTRQAGPVRVLVFDLDGRLVRTLLDEASLPADYYGLRLDLHGAGAAELTSGVYFYRVEAYEGVATGRFTVLK